MDRLLWDDALSAAQRQIALTTPGKRDYFQARLALRMKWPDAATRLAAVWSQNPRDPGLIADKARWQRETGDWVGARPTLADSRPDERRVGTEGVRTCRSRCAPSH